MNRPLVTEQHHPKHPTSGPSRNSQDPITQGHQQVESSPDLLHRIPSQPSTFGPGHTTAISSTTSTTSSAGTLVPAVSVSRALLDSSKCTNSSASNSNPEYDEFEMDPITPAGHRRRRSSLVSPAGNASGSRHRSPRPARNQSRGPNDSKISEEGSDGEFARLNSRDEVDLSDEDLHDDEETGLTGRDRRKKRLKKSRITRLDQRIARDDNIIEEEKKEADKSVVKSLALNVLLIGLWYFFSLMISLYNKWMFGSGEHKLNFPFPLFTTSTHMLVQFSLASCVLFFIPSLRPRKPIRSDMGQSRHETDVDKPLMTKLFYLTRIGPCGIATGLDIGLGNMSLQFITLTFYTMCKSSSLAFVLIFAFLFRLEAPTWKLVAIIGTMTLGVVMMVAGEVEFKLEGFILVIAAAFFSGFRWGLTQILLLRNPATSNPFSSIFFLAPVMFVTLVSIAIPVEGFFALVDGLRELGNEHGLLVTPLIILFPGTIAFLMTASEFALLQRTSVVTLSIAGIFKEAVTISAAAIVFGDTMTPINIVGLLVTLVAIAAYNYLKISKMRQEAQTIVHHEHIEGVTAGGFSSSSNSGHNSDADGDGDGEEVGLLRRSTDVEETLFSADGTEAVTAPKRDPSRGRSNTIEDRGR